MIEIIENIVCNACKVSFLKVHTSSRKREVKDVRQIVMFLTKERYPKKSLAEIAGYYGQKHCTCIHAIKTVNNLINSDSTFRINIEFMRLEIDAELSEGLLENITKERDSLKRIIDKYQIKLDGLNNIILKINKVKDPEVKETKIHEAMSILVNDFKSPFKDMPSANNKEYSGYREHSL